MTTTLFRIGAFQRIFDLNMDGDGIKNGIDNDSDGDGTPDAADATPGGPS